MKRIHWLTLLRGVALLAVVVLFLALPSPNDLIRRPPAAGPAPAPTADRVLWLILAIPLLAHGLAHLSGLIAPFTQRNLGFSDVPWVFAHGITPHSQVGRAFGLLWLAAALALVGAGLGLLLGQSWWATLALAAAALSLALILIWWPAVPPGARVGAALDLVILLAAFQSAQTLIMTTSG